MIGMTLDYLAHRFRRGIEIVHQQELLCTFPFSNFPNACCGDVPELLAQYMIDNGVDRFAKLETVYGTYRFDNFDGIYGHQWLEVDGIIVDICADQKQFKQSNIFPQDAVIACFVGTKSDFHSLFEDDPVQRRSFNGLIGLGKDAYERMKPIYDTIVSCIE